jgi:hypothetical protein
MDICDKNIDYSNKIDNLIDLRQNYNTNKDHINNQITFKEKDIFNNDIDLKTSTDTITTYTANKDTYNINSTNNYNEAKRQNRSCRWSGPWYRKRYKCSYSHAHNGPTRDNYNREGKK